MHRFLLVPLISLGITLPAAAEHSAHASSPAHRVAMLELYTSQGCSSCPPADRFLSRLRDSGISARHLVPMALHVTYWDYIGWRDRYADSSHDRRQRELGRINELRTVYTPQFVLDGRDFRNYRDFTDSVRSINDEKATVDLKLAFEHDRGDSYHLRLEADTARDKREDIALFIAVQENNLVNEVDAGENEGETLKHDFVVRRLYGPHFVSRPAVKGSLERDLALAPDWKSADLSIVGFAQDMRSGEVLQTVSLPLATGREPSARGE